MCVSARWTITGSPGVVYNLRMLALHGNHRVRLCMQGKGRKRKLDPLEAGADRPVFKWRRERKK